MFFSAFYPGTIIMVGGGIGMFLRSVCTWNKWRNDLLLAKLAQDYLETRKPPEQTL